GRRLRGSGSERFLSSRIRTAGSVRAGTIGPRQRAARSTKRRTDGLGLDRDKDYRAALRAHRNHQRTLYADYWGRSQGGRDCSHRSERFRREPDTTAERLAVWSASSDGRRSTAVIEMPAGVSRP